MASKKKTSIPEEKLVAPVETPVEETPTEQVVSEVKPEEIKETKKAEKESKKSEPKYKIGSIVFVSKDAEADLNGFKLFPQYKKYTYTVEAYDAISGVYTLRRLNLSLKLKEALIVAPDERAHDPLNRKQF